MDERESHSKPAPFKGLRWHGLLILAMVASGGWGAGCTERGKTTAPAAPTAPTSSTTAAPAVTAPSDPAGNRHGSPALPVSVQTVRRDNLKVTTTAIGSIAAANTAVVRAQVSGVLQSLHFQEGQRVQAHQLLARIDPRPFDAALAQAEGALARDKAQWAGARVDLARYQDLWAQDAIPRQQLETQQALVGQLAGTVKADEGAVATARVQQAYTRVTAPIPGRVGLKQADLGNVVQPADANGIVTIAQTQPIALVFSIPSAHVGQVTARLRAGQPLPVTALERGSQRALAVGQVASVDNAIDPATDTLKVKALFANTDDALYPNQSVNVSLQLDTLTAALLVPQVAVQRGSQGAYVYLLQADGTVTARALQPGPVNGAWMAVEAQLQPGDQVVTDGMDKLREGARVNVIAAGAAAAAPTPSPPPAQDRPHRGAAAKAGAPR